MISESPLGLFIIMIILTPVCVMFALRKITKEGYRVRENDLTKAYFTYNNEKWKIISIISRNFHQKAVKC